MSRSRVLPRAVALALALCSLPSSASAHTALKRSEPAKGSTLSVAPTRIALWFTARPQLPFSRLRLTGPAGDIPLAALVADTGNAFHADIQAPLSGGEYRVEWQTASADGHAIRGEFSFTVLVAGTTSGGLAPATGPEHAHEAPPEAHAGHSEYRSARWLEFVALLTVLGALGFRHGVLPPLAARGVPTADAADRARRLGLSVLIVYAIAALTRAYTESVAVHGVADAMSRASLVPMLTGTTWGIGWMFGVVGALFTAAGWLLSRRSVTVGTPLALTGALGMTFSPALSGHAASGNHFMVSVVFDVLHVAGAGVWIGGLVMVLFAGIPAMRRLANGNLDAAISALVNSFHPIALFCAPIVVAAGLGTAWLRLGSLTAFATTEYGRTLLLKLCFVVVVVGMGAYNSVRARRRLGDAPATKHFRLTGTFELLFAALVLAVTTVLVTTPVPGEIAP